jgi:uncharacterized protein involved in exopolysaccharide biosynthesis
MESIRPRRVTEFLEIIWRRKSLLLLMAAAMMIATFFAIKRVPNTYESRALVVVNLRTDEQGAVESSRFAALQQELTSRATLATLIRKHGLYPEVKDIEVGMAILGKSIRTETQMRGFFPETPESVSIAFRYTEPATARNVVADLVKILERGNDQRKLEAGAEVERLAAQVSEVEGRLKAIGPQRDMDLVRLDALNRSRTQSDSLLSQYQTLSSSVETLKDKAFALDRQIADQRKLIADQEKVVKSYGASSALVGSAAYGQLLIRKSELEAEIKNNSQVWTDKSPKMVQLNSQLAEIKRQLEHLESGADASSASSTPATAEVRELRQMQRELLTFERELEVVRRELSRKTEALKNLPPHSPAPSADIAAPINDSASRSEYDRLLSRYNFLLDKQDSMMRLSGAKGAAGLMFNVVDSPNLPQLPVAPKRMILQLVALGMALAFGLVVAFAVELPRLFLINDDRDIEYYLGAPVLAMIPETLTPVERNRKRKVRMTQGLLVLIVAMILVPGFFFLLSRLELFQILGAK